MKTLKNLICVTIVPVLIAVASANAGEEPLLTFDLDLVDGSLITGTTNIKEIYLRTPYAKMTIDIVEVSSISIDREREKAFFKLKNGDNVSGTISLETLQLNTILGKVAVSLKDVKSIAVSKHFSKKNLLLHYSFDSNDGDRVLDQSGKQNYGTAYKNYSYVDGVAGKALKLVGSGSSGAGGGHVMLPNLPFEKMSAYSISLWVKEEGMTQSGGEDYICFDKSIGRIKIGHQSNNVQFGVGDSVISKPFRSCDRNKWVHYCLTYGEGTLHAYRDGVSLGSMKAEMKLSTIIEPFYKNENDRFALGRHWWWYARYKRVYTSTRFTGAMDEVKIWGQMLTADQVKHLHKMKR